MIDTHAHLDACPGPLEDMLERARAAGVSRVVAIGTDVQSARVTLRLAEQHAGVYASLGIHPHEAAGADATGLADLASLFAHARAVAVGETGLDYVRLRAPRADQRRLFDAQLALATDTGRPVVVHSRGASADTAAALAGFPGRVVLHCFSEPDLLSTALDRGYYVSFAGNVTYPKAHDLREAAQQVPSARILAETDAPFLAPQPVRGEQNEPAFVMHTVAALAEVRGEEPAALGAQIDTNATEAFGLP